MTGYVEVQVVQANIVDTTHLGGNKRPEGPGHVMHLCILQVWNATNPTSSVGEMKTRGPEALQFSPPLANTRNHRDVASQRASNGRGC